MPHNEAQLLRIVDGVWDRGVLRQPFPDEAALVDLTTTYKKQLFIERTSELSIWEDENGLTAVSAEHPGMNQNRDDRSILAANLSPNENTLTLEIHNYRQPAHRVHREGQITEASSRCRALVFEGKDTISLWMANKRSQQAIKMTERDITMPEIPSQLFKRALGIKVLSQLVNADKTADVLQSNYARKKLLESHCASDPEVRNAGDFFFMTCVKSAVRHAIGDIVAIPERT